MTVSVNWGPFLVGLQLQVIRLDWVYAVGSVVRVVFNRGLLSTLSSIETPSI